MILTSKQSKAWLEILENPQYRRILFDGGARSTKTVLICLWLIVQAYKYPGALILMARKHRDHARKSLWDDTLRKLLRGRTDVKMRDADMEVEFSNGSRIRVDGLDDQDRVDKILGTEYDHIFFNEASQLSWSTINTVLTRLARSTVPIRKAIFDCNPKNQRHWLYRAGVMNVDPETGEPLKDASSWARMHWTPYDNPHLPADAIATLEALSGVQRRRMLNGEWCESTGAVYDEFDEDLHVIGTMPKGWESWNKVRGIDFGYTNPFVCLWGAVDSDGRLYIFAERYVSQQTVRVHAEAIKAKGGDYIWTVTDHDAEDRATLRENGIITKAARKAVEPGINAVKERLKVAGDDRARLFVLKECRATIGELHDYVWAPVTEGKNSKEEPTKDRDHAMDALRYMVMQLDHSGGSGLL